MHTTQTNIQETDVVRRAYQILKPLLLAEPSFRASVSAVSKHVLRFTRARAVIEHRAVTRQQAPASARGQPLEPLITPRFDPWQVEPGALPAATRQLCACSACSGDRRQDCASCGGSGAVETWLEVSHAQRVEVRATPANIAHHWLATSLDEADFLRDEWLHRLEREEVLSAERLASSEAALPPELRAELGPDDRVLQVVLQTFVVDAYEVCYDTAFGAGRIELAGSPLTEFDVVRGPLIRRNVIARSAVALGALASVIAALSYRVQHPWFAKYGQEVPALLIGFSASLLLGAALLGWLRARASRTALSTWCPTAGALALWAACSALLASTQPSVADARDALHKRDLERAELTADALQTLGLSPEERTSLRDDIRLARIESAHSLSQKLLLAERGAWSEARQPEMRHVLLRALEPYTDGARTRNDSAALEQLSGMIATVLPSAANALAIEAAAMESRACIASSDVACIERSAAKLGKLGAVALREQTRATLIALLRERFERALLAVSRSRTARVELEHVTEAIALSEKLVNFDAPIPHATRIVLERSRVRAEAQVEAAAR